MKSRSLQRGAILATFAIGLLSMLLMCGLAIDVGFLYMTRAALSKGTDAAALMGVRGIGGGLANAEALARSTFAMNYALSGIPAGAVSAPVPTVAFSVDPGGNTVIDVSVTVSVNTFFLRLLPGRDVMSVSSKAQAARAKLIMGLALDRSGSMTGNGGAAALPGAVSSFIDFFDEVNDQVAMASFASYARVDVPMTHTFKSPIKTRARALSFGGLTYSHGGIDFARAQINGVVIVPPQNTLKALVFFTDGHANSFLGDVSRGDVKCTSSTAIPLILLPGSGSSAFASPATGSTVTCSSGRAPTFYSLKYRGSRTRNSNNVTEEGMYRAENSAALARGDGTLVFAIGLGNDIDKDTLRRIANDRSSPTFNPAQPEGLAVFAPTAAELDDVFRQIAARILLRLTR